MRLLNLSVGILEITIVVYGIYKIYKLFKAKENKENKPEPLLALQTDNVKYLLYDANWLSSELRSVYRSVIYSTYWFDEPFYSKFFQLLLIIDKNEFMIVDFNAKKVTMDLRNTDNKVHTSIAYQVFSTRDIIKFVLIETIADITWHKKEEAQNILIALLIYSLHQSVYALSNKATNDIIDEVMKDYQHTAAVFKIVGLMTDRSYELFITYAFEKAFHEIDTLPYNDRQSVKPLQIFRVLPKKNLQTI